MARKSGKKKKTSLKDHRKLVRQGQLNACNFKSEVWFNEKLERANIIEYRRNEAILFMYVDFLFPQLKLVIEIDGESHKTRAQKLKDIGRDKVLISQNYRIIRVHEGDNEVANLIIQELHSIQRRIHKNTQENIRFKFSDFINIILNLERAVKELALTTTQRIEKIKQPPKKIKQLPELPGFEDIYKLENSNDFIEELSIINLVALGHFKPNLVFKVVKPEFKPEVKLRKKS